MARQREGARVCGGRHDVMAAAVEASPTFRVNPPRAVFRPPTINRLTINNTLDYEMTADGRRFLVNTPSRAVVPITVVLNWTSALNR